MNYQNLTQLWSITETEYTTQIKSKIIPLKEELEKLAIGSSGG